MKTLVVYYSRTGNTKFVAEKITTELNAGSEEIIDKKKRSGSLGFAISGLDATRDKETEKEETRKQPGEYDLIIIGTPVWNSRLTPAVRTYLKRNDLSGKKIALFCTNQGSETDRTFRAMKELTPNCSFIGELVITNTLENKEDSEKKIAE